MIAWWQSLTTLEQALLYLAVPATLVLLIQTLLLFIGGVSGGGAEGVDLDGDGVPDMAGLDLDGDGIPDITGPDLDGDGAPDSAEGPSQSLHILTVRGVVAFLTLFGWGGLWLCQLLPGAAAVFLAVPIGFAGMVAIALIVRQAMRLQYDGTLNIRNAVGKRGTVYLTIPARRAAPGKVSVTVQEQLREFEAVTSRESPIPTGSAVRVVGLTEDNLLLVEAEDPEDGGVDLCDMAMKMKNGFRP